MSAPSHKLMLRFGVYYEPDQFVRVASLKRHPFFVDSGLASVTLRALQAYLGLAPHEVIHR
eukprot:3709714-Amphidinium_carterae.1